MSLTSALRFAGRNGPWVISLGVGIGIAAPSLAKLAYPFLACTVFAFTFGSFLKVDWPSLKSEITKARRNLVLLLWIAFGVPATMSALILAVKPEAALAQGLLLWSLAPPSGASAALAVILSLNAPLALLVMVIATALSPFYMPVLASGLGGLDLHLDPLVMAVRLITIVGGAWVCSALLKRLAPGFVQNNPDAMTGITVLALLVNGLAAMHGMQDRLIKDPVNTLGLVLLGYAVNLGFQAASALLFARLSGSTALTVGPTSGNRNVSLAWAAAQGMVLPMGEVFFAASVIAIHTSPALTKKLITWLMRPQAVPAPA